jgi:hypothetical protein
LQVQAPRSLTVAALTGGYFDGSSPRFPMSHR